MSEAITAPQTDQRPKKVGGEIKTPPPIVADDKHRLHQIDPTMPLHRLAAKRVRSGRDLKCIVTAENSETGVGKSTVAGWLALSWTAMFTGRQWFCKPEEPAAGMATLDPGTYWKIIKKVGPDWDAGTVVLVDDAEELDARRAMQSLNVEFSQRWMLMRLKQAITIVTLPSPSAIDSRLEELADVWLNIERRGRGLVHDLRVENYGGRNVLTKQEHQMEFPDVSNHPELNKLRDMKEKKMDEWDDQEERPDPEAVKKQMKSEHAQRLRELTSLPIESQKDDQPDIASVVKMSQSWVSKNTSAP